MSLQMEINAHCGLSHEPDFASVISSISQIRHIFNAPAISCGVLHKGQEIFVYGDGLSDIEKNMSADENTVYHIGSCTKAFTVASCGILVDEQKISWTDPIQNYLPEFETVYDPKVGKTLTLLDICSHGSGLAPLDRAIVGFFEEFYHHGSDQLQIASNLPPCYDLRSRFLYNNIVFGLTGNIISRLNNGRDSGTILKENIFNPLGMSRSFTSSFDMPSDGNIAAGYSILDDGSAYRLKPPEIHDGKTSGAAGYVQSSVHDMLIWAKAIMEEDSAEQPPTTSPNPIKQRDVMCRAHLPIMESTTGCEDSYGLGWFRHTLPSSLLGSIGPNFALLRDPPIINAMGPPKLSIAHWGQFQGFLSSFYTFPETCSAVVVFANCSASRGDPTDLIAQALCQHLFSMTPKIDLVQYAERAIETSSLIWPALVEEWVYNKIQGTEHGPLGDYTGVYTNIGLQLTIHVYQTPETEVGPEPTPELLTFTVNSKDRQTAKLRHYHHDTWTFMPNSRDDAIKKGMESYMIFQRLQLAFIRDVETGTVTGLEWDLQAGLSGEETDSGSQVRPLRFVRRGD